VGAVGTAWRRAGKRVGSVARWDETSGSLC
jgi:hypothetical protein